jgi:phage terminase large subunit GpA-like protein
MSGILEQAGTELLDSAPVGIDEKAKVKCPHCGEEFTP